MAKGGSEKQSRPHRISLGKRVEREAGSGKGKTAARKRNRIKGKCQKKSGGQRGEGNRTT